MEDFFHGEDLVPGLGIGLCRDDEDILPFRDIGHGLEEDLFADGGGKDDPVLGNPDLGHDPLAAVLDFYRDLLYRRFIHPTPIVSICISA